MIRDEAAQAGWSLEQALDHMMLMGWRGFKADWVERKAQKQDLWNHLVNNVVEMPCKVIVND